MHIGIVAPLKTICRICCYRIDETTNTYFVEGIVSAKEDKIRECLPGVFNEVRPIKLDKGLANWWICGIKVFWEPTNGKVFKGDQLKVSHIVTATPSVDGNDEFDLHIGLWVKREVLETLAPNLLEGRRFDDTWSMGNLIEVKDKIIDFNTLPQKREAGMKAAEPQRKKDTGRVRKRVSPLRRSDRIRNRSQRNMREVCGA